MKTPIYLAGASLQMDRVKRMAARFDAEPGVELTLRWWEMVESQGASDRDLSDEQRVQHAHADLRAVDQAAIVLVLWSELRSEGRALELGYVFGKSDTITVVAGPDTRRCIFLALCDLVFDADESVADDLAFDAVMSLVEARRAPEMPAVVEGHGIP